MEKNKFFYFFYTKDNLIMFFPQKAYTKDKLTTKILERSEDY